MTDFPEFDGRDEEIVGVHQGSGIELVEGSNQSLSRNYCSKCKKKIHCFVKVDRKTKEAIIHKTCSTDDCECKCRTHYACKICGFLHPHGAKCNRADITPMPDPKNDVEFEKIMEGWRKLPKNTRPLKKENES